MKCAAQVPVIRLQRRSDFLRLTKRGRKFVFKGFILQALPNKESEVRIGFTASKKIGNAVVRSRAKRRLRAVVDEVMRLNPNFSMAPHDICLIARFAVDDLPFTTLVANLKEALGELGATGMDAPKNENDS